MAMSVVSDISSAINLVKQAKELAEKLKNLELKNVIVDLQSKLLDLKEEINRLREENAKLKQDLALATAPPEVTTKDGMYFKGEDGPFCTACYDSRKQLIRLVNPTDPERRMFHLHHKCPVCKASYSH